VLHRQRVGFGLICERFGIQNGTFVHRIARSDVDVHRRVVHDEQLVQNLLTHRLRDADTFAVHVQLHEQLCGESGAGEVEAAAEVRAGTLMAPLELLAAA